MDPTASNLNPMGPPTQGAPPDPGCSPQPRVLPAESQYPSLSSDRQLLSPPIIPRHTHRHSIEFIARLVSELSVEQLEEVRDQAVELQKVRTKGEGLGRSKGVGN